MNDKWYKKISSVDFQNNIWTVLSSSITSLYVFLVVLIVTRMVSLEAAGSASFAFAISLFFHVIIMFGVRLFQGSDVKESQYFHSYFAMRICSALLAVVLMAAFLFVSSFEATRAAVVALTFSIYLSDGFADVFMGDLQQKGKMRIAGRMRVCAFGLSLIAFAITIFLSKTLILSFLISAIVLNVVYITWIWTYRRHFGRIRIKFDVGAIKEIFKDVFPIFLGVLVFNYLFQMQKYYLGLMFSEEDVAILAILTMPVAVISLLSFSLFGGAEITKTANVHAIGKPKEFSRRINKQLLLSAGLMVLFIFSCYIFGLPLLAWVFNVDLSAYAHEFFVLSAGGSLFALYSVLYSVIIVLRRQKAFFYCVMAVAIVVAPLMWFVVAEYGITGAAFTNTAVLVPLVLLSYIVYRKTQIRST